MALPAGHARVVLAVLALHHGEPVARDRIISAAWGGNAPVTAVTQLQGLISTLRRVLPPGAIETVAAGYRLRVEPTALDLAVFESAITRARLAVKNGDHVEAGTRYRAGLDAWRAGAFEGLESAYLATFAARLHQLRTIAVEEWAEVELALGRPGVVVAELAGQLDADPVREPTCALLMLALYRAGRQAEALAAFRVIRKALIQMLGVEPGPDLQELNRRILGADPALILEVVPPAAVGGDDTRPGANRRDGHRWRPAVPLAQLPPDIADFTGRAEVVKHLTDLLSSNGTATSGAPVTCLVTGTAGVGKTTLAVHVAHAVRDRFPDGQVYVDMHAASGRPLTVGQVASRILRDIGVPDETIPSDEQERVALYRSALAGQRVLIVLDDARDGAHTRALLPASGASTVLLTSRSRVVELAALSRLELDVMDHAEASTMFGRIVGADRASAEPKAVSAILDACGYLPLAVRIAASRLATRPRWTVGTLAGRLLEAARRLDELSVDDQQTRSAFEFGYQVLPDHLAGAFRMLAISDVGEISTAAAAALLDVDARTAEQRAESLVDMNLLDTIAPGRYRYHELVRLFAREKAGRVESSAERDRALSRLLAMYHDITQAAAQVVYPGIPGTHDGRRAFDDADDARAWLDAEYRNVVLTLIQCSTMDRPDPARLAQTLDHIRWYLQAGGHWSCWGGVAEAVLDCAVRVGVPSAERTIRHHLATIAARDGTGHLGGELVSCPPADHRSRVVGDP